ncbi:glutathione peroxidase [Ordospora pajunii]|uniref:glutathione peroxidase n=1 Tax=Ordospora pajunii TaxID=3039483 RepID=UPI002952909E|nr:glutathione peroxidase [Ordospora pajunii]KAH9412066.1 glutathione peroxidase [Ordospora pajunii]
MSDESQMFYNLSGTDWSGNEVNFSAFEGCVLLIVNVASDCKFASMNYKNLTKLLKRYYEKGLRILLFPCNQYGNQEPKSIEEIHGVVNGYLRGDESENDAGNGDERFELFDKVDVKGKNQHEVFKHLTNAKNGKMMSFITPIMWNFTKFLVDRSGNVVKRFLTFRTVDMEDKDLLRCIDGE